MAKHVLRNIQLEKRERLPRLRVYTVRIEFKISNIGI